MEWINGELEEVSEFIPTSEPERPRPVREIKEEIEDPTHTPHPLFLSLNTVGLQSRSKDRQNTCELFYPLPNIRAIPMFVVY